MATENTFPIKDAAFVQSLIPQKSPFVMVDALFSYESHSLKAGLTICKSNIFVEKDVFAEAGIIEHMAQSVALHTGYQFFLKNEPAPTGYIGSIRSVSVEKYPKVGDTIETQVSVLQEFMGVTLVEIESSVGGSVIAKAQMKTVIAS